jgi:hypothetical protein
MLSVPKASRKMPLDGGISGDLLRRNRSPHPSLTPEATVLFVAGWRTGDSCQRLLMLVMIVAYKAN